MSEARNLELNDLLSGLQAEGKVVSSGGDFTIHASKAQDKLKEFQLSNPHFYILKLVQSAILAKAKRIDIECQATQVSLKHDGETPEPHELQELLNYIFLVEEESSREQRSLMRMAAGINTAVASQARQILIQCHRDGRSYQQSWTSSGVEFEQLPESQELGLHFVLKRNASDVASSLRHVGSTRLVDLAKGHRNSIQKEEAALWDRCIYAPIPIWVNGELINREEFGTPRYPGYNQGSTKGVPLFHWLTNRQQYSNRFCHNRHHIIQAYYSKDESGETNLVAPKKAHSILLAEKHPFIAGQSCSLILGIESSRNLPNRLNFLRDGVLICQENPELLVRGVFALVCAQDLKTDLSGFQLIRNDKYNSTLKSVANALSALVDESNKRSDDGLGQLAKFAKIRKQKPTLRPMRKS